MSLPIISIDESNREKIDISKDIGNLPLEYSPFLRMEIIHARVSVMRVLESLKESIESSFRHHHSVADRDGLEKG